MLLIFFPFSYRDSHKMSEKDKKQKQSGNALTNCSISSNSGPMGGQNNGHLHTEIEDEASRTSTTIVDLPIRHPLPLELNCQIFKCLQLPIQKKFIWGLGRGIYGMFGNKLLIKTKRVCNPRGNRWNGTNTRATVAEDGLNVHNKVGDTNVFAVEPFPISGPHCRVDEFSGTILYYYELKGDLCYVGFSDGSFPYPDDDIGYYPNSYATRTSGFYLNECWLAGRTRHLELPEGADRPPIPNIDINVFGCGLVLDPKDKFWIFFTLNGKLIGRKIPIIPTVDRLYPTVCMFTNMSLEINFGDTAAKPFKYDIHNCPGLGLSCI